MLEAGGEAAAGGVLLDAVEAVVAAAAGFLVAPDCVGPNRAAVIGPLGGGASATTVSSCSAAGHGCEIAYGGR